MGSNPHIGLISSLPPLKAVKVLDQLRGRIRYLHYSRRTEEVSVHSLQRCVARGHTRGGSGGCLLVCPGS